MGWKIYFWVCLMINALVAGFEIFAVESITFSFSDIFYYALLISSLIVIYGYSYDDQVFSVDSRQIIFILNILSLLVFLVVFLLFPDMIESYVGLKSDDDTLVKILFWSVLAILYLPAYIVLYKSAYSRNSEVS